MSLYAIYIPKHFEMFFFLLALLLPLSNCCLEWEKIEILDCSGKGLLEYSPSVRREWVKVQDLSDNQLAHVNVSVMVEKLPNLAVVNLRGNPNLKCVTVVPVAGVLILCDFPTITMTSVTPTIPTTSTMPATSMTYMTPITPTMTSVTPTIPTTTSMTPTMPTMTPTTLTMTSVTSTIPTTSTMPMTTMTPTMTPTTHTTTTPRTTMTPTTPTMTPTTNTTMTPTTPTMTPTTSMTSTTTPTIATSSTTTSTLLLGLLPTITFFIALLGLYVFLKLRQQYRRHRRTTACLDQTIVLEPLSTQGSDSSDSLSSEDIIFSRVETVV